jgi:hypothetical protein
MCQALSQYVAFTTDLCGNKYKYTCSGETMTETAYLDEACHTVGSTRDIPATCDQIFNDQTLRYTCEVPNAAGAQGGAGGGGSGLNTGDGIGVAFGAMLVLCAAGVGYYVYTGSRSEQMAGHFEIVPNEPAPVPDSNVESPMHAGAGEGAVHDV